MQDNELVKEVHKIMNDEIGENFHITKDGGLTMKGKVCGPEVKDLIRLIMEKAHCSAYSMHPSSTKMYRTIKKNYWWSGMKSHIAKFVTSLLFHISLSKKIHKNKM